MRSYTMIGRDGRPYRINAPAGYTQEQALEAARAKQPELFPPPQRQQPQLGGFGAPAAPGGARPTFDHLLPTPPPPGQEKEDAAWRQAADVPLQIAQGATMGVRFIADAFGADNPVSQVLQGTEEYIGQLFSAQSRNDAAEIARIMQEAEGKGVGEEVKAALKALTIAPVDLVSNALGTMAPMVLSTLAGGAIGLGAGGMRAAAVVSGAIQGAGIGKDTIFEAVEQTLIQEGGMNPEQARAMALEAQSYGGENMGLIMANIAAGGAASGIGAEKSIAQGLARRLGLKEAARDALTEAAEIAAKQAARSGMGAIARGAAAEAIPEGIQGGTEQYSANVAVDRQGFARDPWAGVAGGATLEAGVGAPIGGVTGLRDRAAAMERSADLSHLRTLRDSVARVGEDVPALGDITPQASDAEGEPTVRSRGQAGPGPIRRGQDLFGDIRQQPQAMGPQAPASIRTPEQQPAPDGADPRQMSFNFADADITPRGLREVMAEAVDGMDLTASQRRFLNERIGVLADSLSPRIESGDLDGVLDTLAEAMEDASNLPVRANYADAIRAALERVTDTVAQYEPIALAQRRARISQAAAEGRQRAQPGQRVGMEPDTEASAAVIREREATRQADERRELELADVDTRVQAGRERALLEARERILREVIADESIRDPKAAFAARLGRMPNQDPNLTSDELHRAERARVTREGFSAEDRVPASPNEMDPAALGIPERVDQQPQQPQQRTNPNRSFNLTPPPSTQGDLDALEAAQARRQRRAGEPEQAPELVSEPEAGPAQGELFPRRPFTRDDMRAIGIGPTNRSLADLVGMDLSDPAQATQVAQRLLEYANARGRSPALRDRIIQAVQNGEFMAEPAPTPEPETQPEPEAVPKWAEDAAQRRHGVVLHTDPEFALIEHTIPGTSTVKVIAVPVPGIEIITPAMSTRIAAAKDAAAAQEQANHQVQPNGPFASGERFAASESIDPRLAQVAQQWTQMLGIKARVFLIDAADYTNPESANRYGLYGPFASLREGGVTGEFNQNGVMRTLPSGDVAVVLNTQRMTGRDGRTRQLEVLAHEIGHALEAEAFADMSPTIKNILHREHAKWVKSARKVRATKFVSYLRARASAQEQVRRLAETSDPTIAEDMAQFDEYWGSFSEWFADQVSRWAVSDEVPRSAIERVFQRIGQALKKLYTALWAESDAREIDPVTAGLPNHVVRQYLNSRVQDNFRLPAPIPPSTAQETSPESDLRSQPDVLEERRAVEEAWVNALETAAEELGTTGTTLDDVVARAREIIEEEGGAPPSTVQYARDIVDSADIPADTQQWTAGQRPAGRDEIQEISERVGNIRNIRPEANKPFMERMREHFMHFRVSAIDSASQFETDVSNWLRKHTGQAELLPDGITIRADSLGRQADQGQQVGLTVAQQGGLMYNTETQHFQSYTPEVVLTRNANGTYTVAEKRPRWDDNTQFDEEVVFTNVPESTAQWLAAHKASLGNIMAVMDQYAERIGDRALAWETAQQGLYGARYAELKDEYNRLRAAADKAREEGNERAAEKIESRIKPLPSHLLNQDGTRVPLDDAIQASQDLMAAVPELRMVQMMHRMLNMRMIDSLQRSGRIDQATADLWRSRPAYVPFIRDQKYFEEGLSPEEVMQATMDMQSLPEFEGGDAPIRDVFQNIMEEVFWMTGASLRSEANRRMVDMAREMYGDRMKKVPKNARPGMYNPDAIVTIYRNGEPERYELPSVEAKWAFDGTPKLIQEGAFRWLAGFSNILRKTVTANPEFAVSQNFQDAWRAMFASQTNQPLRLAGRVFSRFATELAGGDDTTAQLSRTGIGGVLDSIPGHAMDQVMRNMHLKAHQNIIDVGNRVQQYLGYPAMAQDMSLRSAAYIQAISEGAPPAVATMRAREIINFNRIGRGKFVRMARAYVPFFNAWIQGMDVMYRAATVPGLNARQRSMLMGPFVMSALKLGGLMTLYSMALGGDDEWESLTDQERDRMLFIPSAWTGTELPLKIPVAPEIGFMVKGITDRVYRQMISQNTSNPREAKDLMKSLALGAVEAMTGPNMTPQAFKPTLEVITNYDFRTGSAIEGRAIAELEPRDRYDTYTSQFALAIARGLESAGVDVSPMKVDHLLRGHLGITGGMIMDASTALFGTGADIPLNRTPMAKLFVTSTYGRQHKEDFYEYQEDVLKTVNSINRMIKAGQVEEYANRVQDPKVLERMAHRAYVQHGQELNAQFRDQKLRVQNMPSYILSREQKMREIQRIEREENEALREFTRGLHLTQ